MNSDEADFKNLSDLIPYYGLLGIQVIHASEGRSRLRLPFKTNLTIPRGTMHGGAIASLADSAVAVALLTLTGLGTKVVTIDLNLNYLAPVKGAIVAEAKITHRGSGIAFGDVDIRDEENKLVAKASATYAIR